MKFLFPATAVVFLSVTTAQAAPSIYGSAFITTDYVDAEFKTATGYIDRDIKIDTAQVNSHASRFGLKGHQILNESTDVIYKLEYGTAIDGNTKNLKSRDTYLGLTNQNLGELRVGTNAAPLGVYNNVTVTEGYWNNLGSTKLRDEKKARALNMAAGSRKNNSIMWKSPNFEKVPIKLAVMYSTDEKVEHTRHGYGAVLKLVQPSFTAGLAYDKDQSIRGDILRGTLTYNAKQITTLPLTMGLLYQEADYDDSETDEQGVVVSAELQLVPFVNNTIVYTQFNHTSHLGGLKDAHSNQFVAGAKYEFAQGIIAHAYAGYNKAENLGYIDRKTDPAVKVFGDAGVYTVGGGLEYLF